MLEESGSGAGTQRTAVIRVTPGIGLRVATPLGPARLDVAYNPYKLQAGHAVSVRCRWQPHPSCRDRVPTSCPAKGKFTFHIAVGQPF